MNPIKTFFIALFIVNIHQASISDPAIPAKLNEWEKIRICNGVTSSASQSALLTLNPEEPLYINIQKLCAGEMNPPGIINIEPLTDKEDDYLLLIFNNFKTHLLLFHVAEDKYDEIACTVNQGNGFIKQIMNTSISPDGKKCCWIENDIPDFFSRKPNKSFDPKIFDKNSRIIIYNFASKKIEKSIKLTERFSQCSWIDQNRIILVTATVMEGHFKNHTYIFKFDIETGHAMKIYASENAGIMKVKYHDNKISFIEYGKDGALTLINGKVRQLDINKKNTDVLFEWSGLSVRDISLSQDGKKMLLHFFKDWSLIDESLLLVMNDFQANRQYIFEKFPFDYKIYYGKDNETIFIVNNLNNVIHVTKTHLLY
jgi:hypothetical protein